jgi:hypothetical protein
MRRYFFDIRSLDHAVRDEEGAQFQNDDAALNHAVWMIQRLKAGGGYQDPALVVEVKDEVYQVVLSIPFYAACA